MTATAPLPADVGGAVELLDRIDTWEAAALTPETNQALEELMIRSVQLAGVLQRAWPAFTRGGSAWEAHQYASRLRTLRFLADTVTDLLTRIEAVLVQTEQRHPGWTRPAVAQDVAGQLEATREIGQKTRDLAEWLNRQPPALDEPMIAQAYQSLDRGEGELLADLIARVTGGGPLVKE